MVCSCRRLRTPPTGASHGPVWASGDGMPMHTLHSRHARSACTVGSPAGMRSVLSCPRLGVPLSEVMGSPWPPAGSRAMRITEPDNVEHAAFGVLLKRYRVAAGLSQEALAERARLSVRAVSAYERGERQAPYRDSVALLVQALGLSPEEAATLEAAVPRRRGPEATPSADDTAASITRPPETPPTNLPMQLTSFVGRRNELAEVLGLLDQSRLLTLIGAGGAGKSRLALQAAGAVPDRYPDGVWLVELAPLTDAAAVPRAVAAALGLGEDSDAHPVARLQRTVRGRALLLV